MHWLPIGVAMAPWRRYSRHMHTRITLGKKVYGADLSQPLAIGMPLHFNGPQPKAFGLPEACAQAYETEGFTGDINRGGAVNCDVLTLAPHGNGMHTECIGHITGGGHSVHDVLKDALLPACVVSLEVAQAYEHSETYIPAAEAGDRFITKASLQKALADKPTSFYTALVIRTLPNDESKQTRNYEQVAPPFLSAEAMAYVVSLGVEHLLVDFPSVDRPHDDGLLHNHRTFWQVLPGSCDVGKESRTQATISEMVYVPDEIMDGIYLLSLQIPAFMRDAAPSRAFLYQVEECDERV